MRRADIEAVGGAVVEPMLDRVGHFLRTADRQEVAAAARDRVLEHMAHRDLVGPVELARLGDEMACLGQRRIVRVHGREQVFADQAFERQLQFTLEQGQVQPGRDQRAEPLVQGKGLVAGAPDIRHQTGQHSDVFRLAPLRNRPGLDLTIEALRGLEGRTPANTTVELPAPKARERADVPAFTNGICPCSGRATFKGPLTRKNAPSWSIACSLAGSTSRPVAWSPSSAPSSRSPRAWRRRRRTPPRSRSACRLSQWWSRLKFFAARSSTPVTTFQAKAPAAQVVQRCSLPGDVERDPHRSCWRSR